ncbi:hypothetical protein [Burkholderia oklahomensis]|uniref:hypothetical protein n=1 Tax=Burkholderia oklahomensis TaxID=342113 RepID=UPI000A4F51A1|nr:hypothetical protein [Burkholderia oklahomensis]MBI0360657.1 hypothetical protein [Burkholderia oklahomensis]
MPQQTRRGSRQTAASGRARCFADGVRNGGSASIIAAKLAVLQGKHRACQAKGAIHGEAIRAMRDAGSLAASSEGRIADADSPAAIDGAA